jgi:glycosyltransferase involved in cell wall biosynthesis
VRVVWITPGFRADERDWFIPALYRLASQIRGACDLHVVTLRYPERRGDYTVGGIPVHALGRTAAGIAGLAGEWHAAAAVLRRLRPDVIHGYWVLNSGLIAARFAGRAPVLVTAAGGEVIHLPGVGYGEAGRARTRLLVRWALKHATAAAALSEIYASQVQRFLRGISVLCTPWGVEKDDWRSVSPDPSSTTVLSVGSLEPVKGPDVLLEAFERIRRRVPAARLRLVGDGTLRDPLRERAAALGCAASVDLSGWVRHEHLPDMYAGAGVYVQASHFESQGMAVLEAAACGLPLAGTNVGVLSELAPGAAVAVPPGQPGVLADAVLELLLDRPRATSLGERARQLALEKYGVERIAGELLTLYQRLCRKGSSW